MTHEKQNSTADRRGPRGSRAHKGFENLIAHPCVVFAFSLVVSDYEENAWAAQWPGGPMRLRWR
jgi:hypothetical protein